MAMNVIVHEFILIWQSGTHLFVFQRRLSEAQCKKQMPRKTEHAFKQMAPCLGTNCTGLNRFWYLTYKAEVLILNHWNNIILIKRNDPQAASLGNISCCKHKKADAVKQDDNCFWLWESCTWNHMFPPLWFLCNRFKKSLAVKHTLCAAILG